MPRRYQSNGGSFVAGSYIGNEFLIDLPSETAFASDGKIEKRFLPVFVHEYFHYIHNISTVVGVQDFLRSQTLTCCFFQTLDAEGRSNPSELSGEQADVVRNTLERERASVGDLGPPGRNLEEIDDFRVVGIAEAETGLTADVEVCRARSCERLRMTIGSRAIEESVAALVEAHVRTSLGLLSEGEELPCFPYKVVEQFVDFVVPGLDNSREYVSAALGTLALLDADSGMALHKVVSSFGAAFRRERNPEAALRNVIDEEMSGIKGRIAEGAGLLSDHVSSLDGLGGWQHCVREMENLVCRGLRHRAEDPIFDVRAIFVPTQEHCLTSLSGEFPPCNIMQGQEDGESRLFDFPHQEGTGSSLTFTDVARILQAQCHWVRSHIDVEQGCFVGTGRPDEMDDDDARACRFFLACPFELRDASPQVCLSHPWTSIHGESSFCWYGAAVRATLGESLVRTSVTKLTRFVRKDGDG